MVFLYQVIYEGLLLLGFVIKSGHHPKPLPGAIDTAVRMIAFEIIEELHYFENALNGAVTNVIRDVEISAFESFWIYVD